MTEAPAPRFSILIPTWNNLGFLKLCIESVEKNSKFPHEILIHVNDGSDGTLEWVRDKGYKHTWSKENIGVCWAMNSLRSLMSTHYLVYVNDDMYLLPGWDTALYEEIQKVPGKLWYFGCTLIESQPRIRHYIDCDFGRTPETFREKELLETYKSFRPEDWSGVWNPPTVVHRDIWDLVGGYSVEFSPGMASDPDFNAKLWMAGVRIFKGVGRSLVYHFKSVSVNRIVKNDGPGQFLRKWGLTVRAFGQQILHYDQPWSEKPAFNRATLRKERIRCSLKNFIRFFKNPKAPRVWDNLE